MSRARRILRSHEALPSLVRFCKRAGLLAILCLAVLGSLEVRKRVRSDERYFLDAWRLELGPLPGWTSPEIRAELEALSILGTGERLSLFEPGVLENVKGTLERTPWIRTVSDIDIRYPTASSPGALRVEYVLRRPIAAVEHGGRYYLAEAEGRRVGVAYLEPPIEWFGVPLITGLASQGPLPEAGAAWTSRDIQQGIEVAKVLFESRIGQDFPDQPIEAIDLSNLHGRLRRGESEVYLRCGKRRLAWGRSPISSGPRTVSVEALVANLRFVLAHPDTFGSLAVIHLHRQPEAMTGVRG